MGFLYDLTDKTQLGLNLQTGTELELEGDAEFTNVVTPANAGGGPSGNFDFTRDAKVPLNIPESAMLGVSHQLTDDLTLLAGATYARWSRFEELDVINKQDGSIITHVTEQWKNTWQFNVGGIWQATSNWKLKAGYAYDESPVDEFVTARIPSQDRHWLTLGTQWKDSQSGWAVDAAVGTLIFDGDAKVNEYKYEHGGEPDDRAQLGGQDDPSNYQAEYDLSAWSASLQVSKAF